MTRHDVECRVRWHGRCEQGGGGCVRLRRSRGRGKRRANGGVGGRGGVPVDGGGMLEAPVNGNPARPPGFGGDGFGAKDVGGGVEIGKILAGENGRVAVEKRAAIEIVRVLEGFY